MIMKKENAKEFKGDNELEIGKDYISNSGNTITIDRKGNGYNNGFKYDDFAGYIVCEDSIFWREATPEEVKERFEAHLIKRYGADWETMKIKEQHPDATSNKNDGLWRVVISKFEDGWGVYNINGLLYYKGIWVERIKEKPNINKPSKIQIGGSHYSDMTIQPIEFIHKNGLSFIQGNIIKYVCRYKSKGGIEDLQKAKHYIDLLIELEEENN